MMEKGSWVILQTGWHLCPSYPYVYFSKDKNQTKKPIKLEYCIIHLHKIYVILILYSKHLKILQKNDLIKLEKTLIS